MFAQSLLYTVLKIFIPNLPITVAQMCTAALSKETIKDAGYKSDAIKEDYLKMVMMYRVLKLYAAQSCI